MDQMLAITRNSLMATSALAPLYHLAMNHQASLLPLGPMSQISKLATVWPSRLAFLAENVVSAEEDATIFAKRCDLGVVQRVCHISKEHCKNE